MAKTFDAHNLLAQLQSEVKTIVATVNGMAHLTDQQLNTAPEPGRWSVAQVVEHLNTYNRYYLPLVSVGIAKARRVSGTQQFKAGWLGEYFVKSMYSDVVTAQKVANKMSAMKGHIPDALLNGKAVVAEFLKDEQMLLQLLTDLKQVDMASIKIPITISKFIKISIGDAIRFLIAHQIRHRLQLVNTLAAIRKEQDAPVIA